jgi:hypothetical protein
MTLIILGILVSPQGAAASRVAFARSTVAQSPVASSTVTMPSAKTTVV